MTSATTKTLSSGGRSADAKTSRDNVRGIDILLVEDNAVTQKLMVKLLEKRGHQVATLGDGRAAVEAVERHSYDLIFMDVQMPEMDGFEATARIRQREAQVGGHVPIVAMTAHAMTGYRERCLEAGMDDYVSKPMKPQDLYDAVARQCFEPDSDSGYSGDVPVDLTGILTIVDGDLDLLRELVDDFTSEYTEIRANLGLAVDQRDASGLEHVAHSLKGAVSHFRAAAAQTAAHHLERLGKEGKVDHAAEGLERLDLEMARLLDYFSRPGWEERS